MTSPAGTSARSALMAGALLVSALATGVVTLGQPTAARVSPPAELISVNGPVAGFDDFFHPSISADGNIVVFAEFPPSGTAVLPPRGWVRDRAANQLTAIPQPANSTGGVQHAVVSRDGCSITFWSSNGRGFAVYKWNRCTSSAPAAITPALSTTLGSGRDLAISADGRFVAVIAGGQSTNAVARVDTSSTPPTIIVATPLQDQKLMFADNLDISDDGQFVAVAATAQQNRAGDHVFGWTPATQALELVSATGGGVAATDESEQPSVSADGRFVAFTSARDIDNPVFGDPQLFVRDRQVGVNHPIFVSPATPGIYADPDILPSGNQVAFAYEEGGDPPGLRRVPGRLNVYEVFVARSTAGAFDSVAVEPVSFGTNDQLVSRRSDAPAMSASGRFVAFSSNADTELAAVPDNPNRIDVWLRERATALTITPEINFGTIGIGATSNPGNAVVTNTSNVLVPVAGVAPPAAPFSISSDGCSGQVLFPGQSCTISLLYRPTAAGNSTSQVAVSGEGLTVQATLRGTGSANPPPTTAPPPPTTGRPGPTTTTTAPAVTTTTLPPPVLSIAPPVIDFGTVLSGTTTATQDFTVSNVGGSPVSISAANLSGAGADQFAFDFSACTGKTLDPGASCPIPTAASPTHAGASEATFRVTGSRGTSASATLRVTGSFSPTLQVRPGVLRPGEVGSIVGAGFPPNVAVQLAFGNEAPFQTVTSDAAGGFQVPLLVFENGRRIGGQVLVAVDQPGEFTGVRTTFLIDQATMRPSGSQSPAITAGIRAVIIRGG